MKEYIGSVITESTRVGDNFIIAPYLEEYVLVPKMSLNNAIHEK